MAHFAEIDSNNTVIRVVVIDNNDVSNNGGDYSAEAETFVSNLVPASENGVGWKQTSYNHNERKQYAGVGFTYDATKDKFIQPQPYPSWSLDTNDDWRAPVEYPNVHEINSEPLNIYWDEDNQKWLGFTYVGDSEDTVNYEWDDATNTWNEV